MGGKKKRGKKVSNHDQDMIALPGGTISFRKFREVIFNLVDRALDQRKARRETQKGGARVF